MNWEDECYLLSKRKFRENANIINVFTPKKGKVSGIVYGGNSRKIRNYLQISNKLFIFYNSKNDKLGYFKSELIEPVAPHFFNDKERTTALISLCSLLNLLLPESQPYEKMYHSFSKLLKNFNLKNWIILYIFFEISLIKELGYDTNLNIFYNKNDKLDEIKTITVDGKNYDVPNFLISHKIPNNLNNFLIKKSLIFSRNILLNKFFLPNNLLLPKSRKLLENYFN